MDVVYEYDGTLEGFLCCVYDSYVYKESPVGFLPTRDHYPCTRCALW